MILLFKPRKGHITTLTEGLNMITSVYQLSALGPKKQKAIADSIFDDLLVMAMAKSFVRNVLEIV